MIESWLTTHYDRARRICVGAIAGSTCAIIATVAAVWQLDDGPFLMLTNASHGFVLGAACTFLYARSVLRRREQLHAERAETLELQRELIDMQNKAIVELSAQRDRAS